MPAFFVPLEEIAALTQGTLLGRPDLVITGVAGLSEAGPGDLTFVTGKAASKEAMSTRAIALLVPRPINGLACAQIVVTNPALAMARVVEKFFVPQRPALGVSKLVSRGNDVVLGEGVSIWPFVTLDDRASIGRGTTLYPNVFVGEGSVIGEDCVIYPNVTIRERVTIGNRVIIHPGTVIGSDGFGYIQEGGRHHKIPQVGTVVIEDDVELGANVTVDRATFGQTVVKRGTKVDNLVQIAHNVTVGEDCILVAQSGIAGSSSLGHHVVMGGQAGIGDHLTIGAMTMIAARSGVSRDTEAGQVVSGSPAIPHTVALRAYSLLPHLPELRQQVRDLERRVRALESAPQAPRHKGKRRSRAG